MAKYSYEFKKKIVDAYLRGEGGYKYLSSIYGPHKKDIQKWVNNYQSFGDEGLMRSRQQKNILLTRNFLWQSFIYQMRFHIRNWLFKKV